MLVYGIDFTSVPSRNNPITCSHCRLQDNVLIVTGLFPLSDWNEFENLLNSDGSWIAGIDFPFGQPNRLIIDLNWPKPWEEYVRFVSSLSKENFEAVLTTYKYTRAYGDKEHLRITDKRAGSLSPMKLNGVPVGKMFFQKAKRLLNSNNSVVPCLRRKSNTIVIEAYPGLAARNLIGRKSYKGNNGDQSRKLKVRTDIISQLIENTLYGFCVAITDECKERCIRDQGGDWLDAILCAVQAGWAYSQRFSNYGVPCDCDINEGWIIDPSTYNPK